MIQKHAATLTAAVALDDLTGKQAPEWILYLPVGKNTIHARMDGKPAVLDVIVDEASAIALQADLAARRQSPVMPALDFDHEGKRASGWPTEFKWDAGRGVLLRAGWTPGGKAAVEMKEYSYFSPEFAYDPATKRVLGLLATGPIGGLVNDPAFRGIGAIMARHESPPASPEANTKPLNTPNMKHEAIVKCMVDSGILTDAEAAADNAPALLTERLNALKAAKATAAQATDQSSTITALRAELAEVKEKEATAAITAAVADGRILAKDTDTQAFWKSAILADPVKATAALAKVPQSEVPKDSTLPGAEKPTGVTAKAELTQEQSAAVSARAQQIMTSSKVAFSVAWSQAESEIRAVK